MRGFTCKLPLCDEVRFTFETFVSLSCYHVEPCTLNLLPAVIFQATSSSHYFIMCLHPQPKPDKLKLIGDYKAKIEKELEDICRDILAIIDESLLPNSQSNEPKVGHRVLSRSRNARSASCLYYVHACVHGWLGLFSVCLTHGVAHIASYPDTADPLLGSCMRLV